MNTDSGKSVTAYIEPSTANDTPETRYQFERQGFFYLDPVSFENGSVVWNRTVSLRDTWSTMQTPSPTAPPTKKKPRTSDVVEAKDPLEGLDPTAVNKATSLSAAHSLSIGDAVLLIQNPDVEKFFATASTQNASGAAVANWLIHELRPLIPDAGIGALPFEPDSFARLVELHETDVLSSRLAKEVLQDMMKTGTHPDDIVSQKGLEQISDTTQLESVVTEVLAAFPDRVAAYKDGKKGLIGFFMGQVMQKTGGKANPGTVRSILESELG